jgi:hypothetical protein
LARRRFTQREIGSFQWEVASGASQADIARKHGFSVSNFRRWFVKYGRPFIPYEPTDTDRANVRGWRQGKTLEGAWTTYREFAKQSPWADDAELPNFDDVDERPDEFEHLKLKTRPDARVVLVCEKMHVEKLLYEWDGPRRPSVAHATRTALAWVPPLASSWVARTLRDHAHSLGAGLAYFGDLDPQALHSFAALRAGGRKALLRGAAKTLPITWMGLDSRWLDWVCRGFGVKDVPLSMTIRMRWLDQEYWHLVKRLLPDVRHLIGPRAYKMLDGGTKLEADALRGRPFVEELGRRLRAL